MNLSPHLYDLCRESTKLFTNEDVKMLSHHLDEMNTNSIRKMIHTILDLFKHTWPNRPIWCIQRLRFAFNTCPLENIYDLFTLHDVLCSLEVCYRSKFNDTHPRLMKFLTLKEYIVEKIAANIKRRL